MPAPHIYLDHNSTTPLDPRVAEAMTRAWRDCGANPTSQHAPGRAARRMLEEARDGIGELLGAKTGGMDADRVIFTSGGTEANNLAVFGLFPFGTDPGPNSRDPVPGRVLISTIEHPSLIAAVPGMAGPGMVNSSGVVQVDALLDPIFAGPQLVSLMLANNETGVIQPVAEAARCGREQNKLVHSDAVQAVGKIRVHFRDLDLDAMTVAPHKFHGPLGIGALIVRRDVHVVRQILGGFQQEGLRPGTENVPLAVGFHEALKLAVAELPERGERMRSLRDQLERALREAFPNPHEMVVIGENAPRLPNTSNVSFPGVNRQALVMALDLAGVACSTGSACASGSSEPSPTLVAMGLPKAVIEGSIRLSLGAFTTAEEVAEAARRIIKAVKHLRSAK
jgi:cysteine desulfurase